MFDGAFIASAETVLKIEGAEYKRIGDQFRLGFYGLFRDHEHGKREMVCVIAFVQGPKGIMVDFMDSNGIRFAMPFTSFFDEKYEVKVSMKKNRVVKKRYVYGDIFERHYL